MILPDQINVEVRKVEPSLSGDYTFEWIFCAKFSRVPFTLSSITLRVQNLWFSDKIDAVKRDYILGILRPFINRQDFLRFSQLNQQEIEIIKYPNGDNYEGTTNENKLRHGYGLYTVQDGSVYTGSYNNGLKEGHGVYIFPNGDKFVGIFFQGNIRQGTYLYANGDLYNGKFSRGQYSEEGSWCNLSGDRYSGHFANGQRHGQGELTLTIGEIMKGEWINGNLVYGIYTFSQGDVYIGEFKNGKISGPGKFYSYSRSKCYQGNFDNGQLIV